MTCRRHPYELGVGVCALCLRERLFTLIDEQNKLAAAASVYEDCNRRPDPNPYPCNPYLHFPRSVSPYISHRRSLGSNGPAPNCSLNRFFSTPPAAHFSCTEAGYASRRKPYRSYSLWSSIFGHSRSEASEPRSSFSWLSALIRRKKQSPLPLEQEMSPERYQEEEDGGDLGYSSDSSPVRRLPGPTPIRQGATWQSRGGGGSGGGRGISGFAVCLSPLVRSKPNRRYGNGQSEAALPGDSRFAVNNQILRPVSYGNNESTGVNRLGKFDDFGRFK